MPRLSRTPPPVVILADNHATLRMVQRDIKENFPENEWEVRIKAVESVLNSYKRQAKYEKWSDRNKDKDSL